MVGIREWEVRTDGSQKCDLLEVYSHTEKDKLKQIEVCDFKYLNEVNSYKETENEQMQFSTAAKEESDDDVEELSTEVEDLSDDEPVQKTLKDIMTTKNVENKITKQNDWLSIDDI